MKNFVASVLALVVGFFTVTFAAIMGLFIGIAALIARPFIKKKVEAAYAEAVKQQGGDYTANSTVIDGEYDDITNRSQAQSQSQTGNHNMNQMAQSL
ncbi:hypothetical protein ACQKP8_21960 [Photobacterium alginatilyticum]|uniref:Uncharacterized protein n=1 Tax=Photobacterium alginatilyticum TaxID=1775171 RepID=A0ABW9YEA1_9GAMM|nr:hypothetical protein [Photobacterium alginatilyticum]NBI51986.1 hypothetical protein [Photobacterium alginatilyticum]